MWQIDKQFEDDYHPSGKGYVYLKADKPMTPYHITYPVTWTGFVGRIKVQIIQKSDSALTLDDFDFKDYPEKYSYLKYSIIKWIHDYLRILN